MVPASLTPPTPADSSTPVEIALVALHGDDEPVCLSRGALEHPRDAPAIGRVDLEALGHALFSPTLLRLPAAAPSTMKFLQCRVGIQSHTSPPSPAPAEDGPRSGTTFGGGSSSRDSLFAASPTFIMKREAGCQRYWRTA
jgi:hypothetical protein